jgi:hypothetical protein
MVMFIKGADPGLATQLWAKPAVFYVSVLQAFLAQAVFQLSRLVLLLLLLSACRSM